MGTRATKDVPPAVAGLADALARLFYDPQRIHDLAAGAGLDVAQIAFDAKPAAYWLNILVAANADKKLDDLLAFVTLQNASLQPAVDTFRQWRTAHPDEPLRVEGLSLTRRLLSGLLFAFAIALPTVVALQYFPWYVASAAKVTAALGTVWVILSFAIGKSIAEAVDLTINQRNSAPVLGSLVAVEIIAALLALRFATRDEPVLRFVITDRAVINNMSAAGSAKPKQNALLITIGGRPICFSAIAAQAIYVGRPDARVEWLIANEDAGKRKRDFADVELVPVAQLDERVIDQQMKKPLQIQPLPGAVAGQHISAVFTRGAVTIPLAARRALVGSDDLQTIALEGQR